MVLRRSLNPPNAFSLQNQIYSSEHLNTSESSYRHAATYATVWCLKIQCISNCLQVAIMYTVHYMCVQCIWCVCVCVCAYTCMYTHTHTYRHEHVCTDTQVDGLPLDFSLSDCMRILAWQFHSRKKNLARILKNILFEYFYQVLKKFHLKLSKLKLSRNGHVCSS